MGKIDLDKTFEERGAINFSVVSELDKASDPWASRSCGMKSETSSPPRDVLEAMEKQMRAEREKRAAILNSEGLRDSNINQAEGEKQKVIKESEAKKQQQINEAEGEGQAILTVATPRPRASGPLPAPSSPMVATRPCSCGWPSSTSKLSATWPSRATA